MKLAFKPSISPLCIDSLNSLHAFKNYHDRNQHPITKEIISCLKYQSHSVVFAWVPNHVNIPVNELADRAAKESS
ncbi:hypothetical protein PGB90_003407 [Kerria lacca]